MTAAKQMANEVKKHIAHRDWSHKVWLKRQAEYQKIKKQNFYDNKSAKIQNMGRSESGGIKAC